MLASGVDPAWRGIEPEPVSPRWTRVRVHGSTRVREGELLSPDPDLPEESRVVRLRLIEPRHMEARSLVIVLASWRDEDAKVRTRLVGPAVRAGVAVLIPGAAFYGGRRRAGQVGSAIRYVADLIGMGRATVTEARVLLAWARTRYERIGVAGYSMGGQMAAMTAALCRWPVRFVGVATSVSPARVFFDGPLHADVASAPLGEGGLAKLRVIMERLNVLDLDPPCDVERALLVGTRDDAIVPPADTRAIARHWGVNPRWIHEVT